MVIFPGEGKGSVVLGSLQILGSSVVSSARSLPLQPPPYCLFHCASSSVLSPLAGSLHRDPFLVLQSPVWDDSGSSSFCHLTHSLLGNRCSCPSHSTSSTPGFQMLLSQSQHWEPTLTRHLKWTGVVLNTSVFILLPTQPYGIGHYGLLFACEKMGHGQDLQTRRLCEL